MACPKCGCKVHYQYDSGWDGEQSDETLERCAACGDVFYIEDAADDDEDTGALASRPLGWGLVLDSEQVA